MDSGTTSPSALASSRSVGVAEASGWSNGASSSPSRLVNAALPTMSATGLSPAHAHALYASGGLSTNAALASAQPGQSFNSAGAAPGAGFPPSLVGFDPSSLMNSDGSWDMRSLYLIQAAKLHGLNPFALLQAAASVNLATAPSTATVAAGASTSAPPHNTSSAPSIEHRLLSASSLASSYRNAGSTEVMHGTPLPTVMPSSKPSGDISSVTAELPSAATTDAASFGRGADSPLDFSPGGTSTGQAYLANIFNVGEGDFTGLAGRNSPGLASGSSVAGGPIGFLPFTGDMGIAPTSINWDHGDLLGAEDLLYDFQDFPEEFPIGGLAGSSVASGSNGSLGAPVPGLARSDLFGYDTGHLSAESADPLEAVARSGWHPRSGQAGGKSIHRGASLATELAAGAPKRAAKNSSRSTKVKGTAAALSREVSPSKDKHKATHGSYGQAYGAAAAAAAYGEPEFVVMLTSMFERMGMTFGRIPVVGGKRLDLELLMVAVQGHGGPAKVTKSKMWRGVAIRMGIPPSVTNAGFLLRKHYHHFMEPFEAVLLNPANPYNLGIPQKVAQYIVDHGEELEHMGGDDDTADDDDVTNEAGTEIGDERTSHSLPPSPINKRRALTSLAASTAVTTSSALPEASLASTSPSLAATSSSSGRRVKKTSKGEGLEWESLATAGLRASLARGAASPEESGHSGVKKRGRGRPRKSRPDETVISPKSSSTSSSVLSSRPTRGTQPVHAVLPHPATYPASLHEGDFVTIWSNRIPSTMGLGRKARVVQVIGSDYATGREADSSDSLVIEWLYRPDELARLPSAGGLQAYYGEQELFASSERERWSARDVIDTFRVFSLSTWEHLPIRTRTDFFVRLHFDRESGTMTQVDPSATVLSCTCSQPRCPERPMLQCQHCRKLFHPEHCMDVSEMSGRSVVKFLRLMDGPDPSRFTCPLCKTHEDEEARPASHPTDEEMFDAIVEAAGGGSGATGLASAVGSDFKFNIAARMDRVGSDRSVLASMLDAFSFSRGGELTTDSHRQTTIASQQPLAMFVLNARVKVFDASSQAWVSATLQTYNRHNGMHLLNYDSKPHGLTNWVSLSATDLRWVAWEEAMHASLLSDSTPTPLTSAGGIQGMVASPVASRPGLMRALATGSLSTVELATGLGKSPRKRSSTATPDDVSERELESPRKRSNSLALGEYDLSLAASTSPRRLASPVLEAPVM